MEHLAARSPARSDLPSIGNGPGLAATGRSHGVFRVLDRWMHAVGTPMVHKCSKSTTRTGSEQTTGYAASLLPESCAHARTAVLLNRCPRPSFRSVGSPSCFTSRRIIRAPTWGVLHVSSSLRSCAASIVVSTSGRVSGRGGHPSVFGFFISSIRAQGDRNALLLLPAQPSICSSTGARQPLQNVADV